MTGLVGAIVEAWYELRTHRVRVLLSLVGVAVAVMAITGVTAAMDMLRQGMAEQADRGSGRPVTATFNVWSASTGQVGATPPDVDGAFDEMLARYDITYASRDLWTNVDARIGTGTQNLQMRAVDPELATIFRITTIDGHWFTADDEAAYAPRVVVNEALLARLGADDLAAHPTVLLGTDHPVRATVVGVVANDWPGADPTGFLLYDQTVRWDLVGESYGASPSLVTWLPPDSAADVEVAVRRDLTARLPGTNVDYYDNRDAWPAVDDATRWVGLGVGAFALLLGGLGLVNISLVTVRHRIREIGIRRSFGATSARIFFGVMMESVVATVVAGFVGVVATVALLKALPLDTLFGGYGLQDVPPFPVSAALLGMAAATGIGALAGLIPAEVAVRVKVIDAIRY